MAPSDIIFDRPPASTIISYSTSEYFNGNNTLQVKSNLVEPSAKNNISVTFNLNNEQQKPIIITKIQEDSTTDSKKSKAAINESLNRELRFIDEENSGSGPSTSRKPPPPTTCLIDSMVRSCSVGKI